MTKQPNKAGPSVKKRKPKPKPQWGDSPPGFTGPDAQPFTPELAEELAELIGYRGDLAERLNIIAAKGRMAQ